MVSHGEIIGEGGGAEANIQPSTTSQVEDEAASQSELRCIELLARRGLGDSAGLSRRSIAAYKPKAHEGFSSGT